MKHLNSCRPLMLLVALCSLAVTASAQLSGTYTIGGTSPNYTTLSQAVAALNSQGVSGPVIFNIRDGSYTDQVAINSVAGASATNRIVIQSESNNAANVTITASASSTSNNHIFKLSSAKYVTIRQLTLVPTNGTYCTAINITGAASHDSILNCNLSGPISTYTGYYGALVQAYNSAASNIVFKNNNITNGGSGFYIYQTSIGAAQNDFVIEGNNISGQYYMPMYLQYTRDFKVRNNTITKVGPYSYSIYANYANDAYECVGNVINISNCSYTGYGLYHGNCEGSATDPTKRPLVANNTLTQTNISTTTYPFWNNGSTFMTFRNNVINATTSSTTYLYNQTTPGLVFRGNDVNVNSTTTVYAYYTYQSHGAIIDSNTFNINTGSGSYYPYLMYSDNSKVSNNTVNVTSTSGTVYGLYPQYTSNNTNLEISGNKVKVSSTSGTVYGIYVSGTTGTPDMNLRVFNNVVTTSTSGTNRVFYATSLVGANKFYNNTFHSRATGSTNYAFYISPSSGSNIIYNNIFSRTGTTGYLAYVGSNGLTTMDHNLYYATSGNILQSSSATAAYNNLQSWRSSTGKDMNSLVYDPGYISATSGNVNDLAPDLSSANSWARNGRGIHIAGNDKDINGNTRVIDRPSGVPDIGAHEFTPTSTPPAAAASPASPTASTTQIFTLGQDTVATIAWGTSVPGSITVRQYTGTAPAGISAVSSNNMYFYTDVNIPSGTYAHTSNIYYQDPWGGSTGNEASLRLAKKDGANPWVVYGAGVSSANTSRNIITTTGSNNFGLHTGVDQGDNAGTNALTSPVAPFCSGNQTVIAEIKNSGNNTLNSVQIGWSVDGIAQTPVSYTTPINTLGSGLGNTATVTLGTVNFGSLAKVIRVWTYSPNGNTDPFTNDDTLTVSLRSSLSGTYTIGGTTPNYPTIAAAVTDLNTYGVCGPVVFDIRNGTYNERTILKPVIGASAINTITFKSETNSASNVTINYSSSSSANYIFLLDSAKHFIFRDLTVKTLSTTYGRVFEFRGNASYDSIINCTLDIAGTTGSSRAGIYAYSPFNGVGNVMKGSTVDNGYYGVYLFGSTASPISDFTFDNNNFISPYYYGLYAYYTNGIKFTNNTITRSGSGAFYGCYLYYCHGALDFSGNDITASSSTSTVYGIYASSSNGSSGSYAKFNNNNLTLNNTYMYGYIYPIQFLSTNYDSIVGNTVTASGNYYIYNNYQNVGSHTFSNNTLNYTSQYCYGSWYNLANITMENNEFTFTAPNYMYWQMQTLTNWAFKKNKVTMTCASSSSTAYIYYPTNMVFEDNEWTSTALYTAYGLFFYGQQGQYQNNLINRNLIKATGMSAYGIYSYYNDDFTYSNNVVIAQGSSSNYALYAYNPLMQNIYNNTLVCKNPSGYVLQAYNNGSMNGQPYFLKLRNNIFYNSSSSGSGLNFQSGDAINLSSDYNNIFVGGSTKFVGGGTFNSLTQWRAAKGQDMNSIMYDPGFTNPSTNDYTPDPANSASWSLNGRGVHLVGNDKDFASNTRVVTKAAGVPDIGAYEFVPTSTPPSATATPAAPAAGTTQVFTLGEDTVATVSWDASATVPSTIDVKQYSGVQPPSFIAANSMYLYTDIAAGSALHDVKIYYKDPQTGTTIGESGLRLVKKDGVNPWAVFASPQTVTNAVLNFNNTTALNTFGLHTMTDVANNASAAELVAPVTAFCAPSTQEVKVKITNTGNNVLNSVKIGWTKNGTPQTTINYTTPIYTLGSAQGNEAVISLGNVSFPNSNGISFVVYTFSPNNATDPATADDTLKFTIKPSLSGTYTIGGTTPDYPTVPDAINDLNAYGICGPVVFNIRDGNYTDGGKIDAPLQGSSAVNRVTFQSESGIAANVVITHAATSANDNAIFGLDNISNITLRNLKMVTTNGSFSTVVAMGGSASYDTIVGCILQAPSSGSTGANAATIQASNPTFSGAENVILKNNITGGYYGIYWNSGGAAVRNIVDSNSFSGQYYYGMSLWYTYGTKVRGNTLTLSSPAYYGVDMMYNYAAGSTATEFVGNTVNTTGPVYPTRIYYLNQGGTATVRGKFADNTINASGSTVYCYNYYPYYSDVYNNKINLNSNGYVNNYFGYAGQYCNFYNNEIKVAGTYGYAWYASNMQYANIYNNVVVGTFGSLSTAYGMYASYGRYDSIYNNSVLITSAYSTSYAMYGYLNSSSYSDNWMRNNLFANFSTPNGAAGAWLSPGSTSYDNTFDYNNYYSANGNHIFNGGTNQVQTLQAWRTATGQDKNSLCYDPGVINNTSDAHPDPNDSASWSLNGRGVHIAGNNADLEGNPRVTTLAAGVPDIGAYEFVPNSTPPLAVATPAVPAVGKQVFTFGQDTVAVLDWKPNSQIPNAVDVRQYTGTVPPSFPANVGFMYFYTDVNGVSSTYDLVSDMYYDDPWRGTISAEANIRMVKKLNPQPWQAYNSPLSSVDVNRNIIRAAMTNLGYMTGIEDGTLFSAIITPGGSGIFCPGGSVVLNANTGIGYTYQWQFNYVDIPGATGSSYTATGAGDYTVKITNSANVTATSLPFLVTIVAPPAAQVSASGPLTYCTGGNLTLNAATAANQSYQWYMNGNIIPSATQSTYQVTSHGNYTVMVKGIGCSSTSPVVTVSEGPIQVNIGQDTSFCEGTPLILDAGYPGAKYLWSTGDTTQQITIYNKLHSGTYTVAVDAGPNCQGSDNIVVTVNPLPSVLGISYVKNGSTYQFSPSGATDVKSYLWIFSDNTTDTAKTATHTFSVQEFEVKLVVFNDCGTDTSILSLPVSVGETANGDVIFTVYPNPASDYVTLSATGDVKFSDVVIINAVGQVVYRGNAELKQKEEVSVSNFANGHYLIRATTAAGMTISKPFNVVR